MRIKLLLLSFLLCFCLNGNGQKTYTPEIVNPLSEMWRWKPFPNLEGKGVRHITEDNNETVWVSVDDGIFEYNGYDWILHDKTENESLTNPIEQVLITKKGEKYAISARHIFKYNGTNWGIVFNTPTNYQFNFSKIIELADGSLMLGSEVGALHYQYSGKHIFYTTPKQSKILEKAKIKFQWKYFPESILNSDNFTNISDLIEDKDGKVWLAFSYDLDDAGQLLQFKPNTNTSTELTDYRYFTSNEGLKLGEESKLIQAKDDKIWVINTSFKAPINVFDNKEWKPFWLSEIFGGD